MSTDRHLSPAEAARRLGVSAKALRLYEKRGLVTPLRSAVGWRVYGPAEMAQLHQVLALKRLGLPLARIAALMASRGLGLDEFLAVQEKTLAQEGTRIDRALVLIRDARSRLAKGQSLTVDDLATLTTETTMRPKATPEEMREIFDPLIAKHYTKEQLAELKERKYDQSAVSKAWDALFAEAGELMAKGDDSSPRALDMARRWKAMVEQFTQGDAKLAESARKVWADVLDDPNTEPKLQVGRELYAFVGKIMVNLRKAEGA